MADKQDKPDEYTQAWADETAEPKETAEQGADGEDGNGLAIVIAAEPQPAEVESPAEAEAEAKNPEQEAAEPPAVEAAEQGGEPQTPEEIQKQKSWEGRLKKREADIAAREAAIKDSPAQQAVASNDLPEDIQAIKDEMAADFGEDYLSKFVRIIEWTVQDNAKSIHSAMKAGFDSLGGAINAALQGMHECAILEAHPDMDDIVSSEGFTKWIDAQDEDKKSTAIAVMQHGMWPQIITLLNRYKQETASAASATAGTPEPEQKEEDPLASAFAEEAPPQSVALNIPNKPADIKDDFEAAWNEA